jgi:hypothetical protein
MKHIVLAALVGCPMLGVSQFNWAPRADLPVSGLSGPATFEIDGKGYIVAGRSGTTDVTTVWMYDPEADSWTAKAPIPAARRYAAGFSINGKGYVACGAVGSSTKLNDLWEYDPVADAWSAKADFPGQARYGTSYFALGGMGYVGTGNLGTSSGPYASDMFAYNPGSNTWSARADIPGLARFGTSTITAVGKAYVVGGKMSDQEFTNEIYEYEPNSDSWTLLTPLSTSARSYALAFSYPYSGAIVAGGNAGVNLYDGLEYLPNQDTWVSLPTYPGASGWVGATMTINGRSFGGLGLNGSNDTNDWWELVKENSADGLTEFGMGEEGSLAIRPNPVAVGEVINFDRSALATSGRITVRIISITGATVLNRALAPEDRFVCPSLGDGAYSLIAMGSDGRIRTGRLAVMTP